MNLHCVDWKIFTNKSKGVGYRCEKLAKTSQSNLRDWPKFGPKYYYADQMLWQHTLWPYYFCQIKTTVLFIKIMRYV